MTSEEWTLLIANEKTKQDRHISASQRIRDIHDMIGFAKANSPSHFHHLIPNVQQAFLLQNQCRMRWKTIVRDPSTSKDDGLIFKRIEHLHAAMAEILVVTGHDGQAVPTRGGGDVTVLYGHRITLLLYQEFLFGPDMRN